MNLPTGLLLLGEHAPRRLISLASKAEELGYADLWYADERFYREVYSSLTLCALNTSRIGLGPCVTDPYSRHPALTAMAIATLDEISGGRARLAVGAGVSGFRELDIVRERPAVAMREMVEVTRRLLRGEEVTYQGQVIRLRETRLNFPMARSQIPIYVASDGPRGLEAAGRVADGAIMQSCVSNAALDYFAEHVQRGARMAGRAMDTIQLVARVNVCIQDDPRVARDYMRRSVAANLIAQQPDFRGFAVAGLEVPHALAERVRGLTYRDAREAAGRVAPFVPDAFVEALTLTGTAEEVAANVARMASRGITQLIIYPMDSDRNIERVVHRFGTEVLPAAGRATGSLTSGRL